MHDPLISCIVPSFNSRLYIREALDSILEQTYRPVEVIVADDGSTDSTPDVVAEYGCDVRLVTQKESGPAATRNLGLGESRGELVAFLDADDLWHPEKLKRQYRCLLEHPEIDYCISLAQLFWSSEMGDEREKYRDHPRAQPMPGYATTTLLARRNLFERIGDFNVDLSFSDATEWFLRASDQGIEMRVVQEVLTYHRMHRSNMTRRRRRESRREFLEIVKDSLDRRRASSKNQSK